jgi:hypothetical protein
MDFNECPGDTSIAYWHMSRSWIASSILKHPNNRISPEKKMYGRPGLTTQGSTEPARSAAGRTKARLFRKYKQAAAFLFILPVLALCHFRGIRMQVTCLWHDSRLVSTTNHNHDEFLFLHSFRAVEWLQLSKIEIILTIPRELVGDLRIGTTDGPRSSYTCKTFHFPFSSLCGFLCGNVASLCFTYFDYLVLL